VSGRLKLRRGVITTADPLTVEVDGERRPAWADETLTRFCSVTRKICSWARTAKSRTASSTGGEAIACETASDTMGRAAETKLLDRARRSVAWSAM